MIDYGNDIEYADSRLRYTFVKLLGSGEVVYVKQLHSDPPGVTLTNEEREFLVPWGRNLLDLTPITLGYTVKGTRPSIYLQRVPLRRDWRQGLRYDNLDKSTKDFNKIFDGSIRNIVALLNGIQKGVYPTIEEAYDETTSGGGKVAFDRHFAVNYNEDTYHCRLLYRDWDIGVVDPNCNITLHHEYQYLVNRIGELKNA